MKMRPIKMCVYYCLGFLFRKPSSQAQMVDTAEGRGRRGEAERGGGEHGGLCSRRLIDFFSQIKANSD